MGGDSGEGLSLGGGKSKAGETRFYFTLRSRAHAGYPSRLQKEEKETTREYFRDTAIFQLYKLSARDLTSKRSKS